MSLTRRARKLYPQSPLAARWVLAVRYLRANKLWLIDKTVERKDTIKEAA